MNAAKHLLTEIHTEASTAFLALWLLITTILRRLIGFIWRLLLPYRLTISLIWRHLVAPPLRLAWRIFKKLFRYLLVVSLLIGVLAFVRNSGVPSYETPKSPGLEEANLPHLRSLTPTSFIVINPKAGVVQIALEIPKSPDLDTIALDVVDVYRWGRSYFNQVKCGADYPPNMCIVGRVDIVLLIRKPDTGPEGRGEHYAALLWFWLDQTQIDQLLTNPPNGLDGLGQFHEAVSQSTYGTGGGAQIFQEPVDFNGFN